MGKILFALLCAAIPSLIYLWCTYVCEFLGRFDEEKVRFVLLTVMMFLFGVLLVF